MTLSVKHATAVAARDSSDGKVSTNAWNQDHKLSGQPGTVVGFDPDGGAQEVAIGAGLSLDSGTLTNIGAIVAVQHVDDRTALSALASNISAAYLRESGREGTFVFDPSDLSAMVTADTAQGVYVPPAGGNGSTGAWVRKGPVLTPFHFGAVGDGVTDDRAALQAFNDFVFATPRLAWADWTGLFAISGPLLLGPAAQPTSTVQYPTRGNLALVQLAPTFESVRIRNMVGQTWHGGISIKGLGGVSFASRTCAVGIAFENCGRLVVTGKLETQYFWLYGCAAVTVSNDEMVLNIVSHFRCGSGHAEATGTLTSPYAAVTNSGASGSSSQLSVLSGVTTFPDAAIETYEAIGTFPLEVRIGGALYFVSAINRVAGTVSIMPWIDQNAATSGTMEWVLGAGFYTTTGDGGLINIAQHQALTCGRGLAACALYGTKVGVANYATCGTGLLIGGAPNQACIGNLIDNLYVEANKEDIRILPLAANGSNWGKINHSYELDLSKVSRASPRLNSNNMSSGVLGAPYGPASAGYGLSYNGRMLEPEWSSIGMGERSPNLTYAPQQRAHRIIVQHLDSQTVNLTPVATDFNRLFGYRGGTLRYVGGGTNAAPTGTITFNPPTLAYASCATTSGSAVVTMPSTAGLIAGMPITGAGIPAATTILSVDSTTQITLSANSTATATVTLTVTGSINGAFAALAVSDFNGPAEFTVTHADTQQLQWNVYVVAGKMAHGWLGTDARGNLAVTLGLPSSKMVQYFNTPLTAARTLTLPAPGKTGRRYRIVRSANATGAFNLNINTSAAVLVKALATAGTWAEVEDNGTEYQLIGGGAL